MSEISGVQPSGSPSDFSALAELVNVQDCFQCQKCSAGCPVVSFMDYKPTRSCRWSPGHEGSLVASQTIWVCASCYTCSTRCPNEVDVAGVMDWLRQRALREKAAVGRRRGAPFSCAFLDYIRTHGRVHELP